MTVSVHGIGWLTKTEYGCIGKKERSAYGDAGGPDTLVKKGIFAHPVKNFGRFDRASRMTCFGAALALRDAGIAYSAAQKQDIGIICANARGSLQTDIDYFRDYVESGRVLSRGNLFIYTLPSSPAGEAAIHFGLRGPLLYAAGEGDSLAPALDTAADMILGNEIPVMLAGGTGPDEAIFLVLAGDAAGRTPALCDVTAARSIVEATPDIPGMVQKFSELLERKALREDKTHLSRVAET